MMAEKVTWMKMSIPLYMHIKSQVYTLTRSLLKLNNFTPELSTKKMPINQKSLFIYQSKQQNP